MEFIPYVSVISVQDAVLVSTPNVSFQKHALSILPNSPPRQLWCFGFFKNVNIEKAAWSLKKHYKYSVILQLSPSFAIQNLIDIWETL